MNIDLVPPRTASLRSATAADRSLGAFWCRHWNGTVAAAILVLGTLLSWLRLPESARGTLWAEDARNFLGNAVASGPVAPLLRPYAGYLQAVPRMIAGLTVRFVPISEWAFSMAAGACLVSAGVSALVFLCTRDLISSVPGRLALASITLLVPLAPREVLGNTANLHWYFLWLAPWLLLYLPRSRTGAWLLGVVALIAATTEIQMAIFLPLLLWDRKNRSRMPVRALFAVGVAMQLVATVVAPRGASTADPIRLASVGYGYLINGAMTIWLPNASAIGRVLTTTGPWGAVLFLLPFLVAAAWGLRHGAGLQRVLIVTLLAGSVVVYSVAVSVSPGTFYDYAAMSTRELAHPWIARYGVVPSMFLPAIVPIAASVRPRRGAPATALARGSTTIPGGSSARPVARRRRLPVTWRRRLPVSVQSLTAALLVALMALQFVPVTFRRANGPDFSEQVAAASQVCASSDPTTAVSLRGAPSATWSFQISCARLDSGRRTE